MKLTKYKHACLVIEQNNQHIIVDPGGLSSDFISPTAVVAVIVTHEHGDHLDKNHLKAIIEKNPNVVILGHKDVMSLIPELSTKAVSAGETVAIGAFTLQFFGGEHALIHTSIPTIANLGVLINNRIYYPGDSFVVPDVAVDTLALPVSAPWMKMSEAIDFFIAVHPRFAFPTHDAIYSDVGNQIADRLLSTVAEKNSMRYQRLEAPIEL